MAIKTRGTYKLTTCTTIEKFLKDKYSPNASFQSITHASPFGDSTTFEENRFGKKIAIAMIQVARMKNRHRFESISGERRGNITAPSRSTAIRTKL